MNLYVNVRTFYRNRSLFFIFQRKEGALSLTKIVKYMFISNRLFISVISLLAVMGCQEKDFAPYCGMSGGDFRFSIIDSESGNDLFLSDTLSKIDLVLYTIQETVSNDPADTLLYLPLHALSSQYPYSLEDTDQEVFKSFIPVNPGRTQQVYVRIGTSEIDTLIVTAREQEVYDAQGCAKALVASVYYNDRLICEECNDTTIYEIPK